MAARKGSLIASAKAARDRVAVMDAAALEGAAEGAGAMPAAVVLPEPVTSSPPPVAPAAANASGIDWVTTAIHVPRDVLILLRRVAVERANLNGGRPSVSAVLTELVRANRAELERETGR